MSKFTYDLFVLGAGSGGVRASRIAAGYGKKVAVAEEFRYGGTCVIRGCVPKKLLMYASSYAAAFEDAKGFGWDVKEAPSIRWKQLIDAKNKEIDRLEGIYGRILEGSGVERINGRASIVDEHTVRVNDKEYSCEHILVAVGGYPFMPKYPGVEHTITSNELLDLEELPKRVLIHGGGFIACEFASILKAVGCDVTMVYRHHSLLRGFDEDIVHTLEEELTKRGIRLCAKTNVSEITPAAGGYQVTLTGESEHAKEGSGLYGKVASCLGRKPNTSNLGLEKIGVKMGSRGEVLVDHFSRSSVPHVFAVGDCTDRINLTPVALNEGHAVADTLFGGIPRGISHDNVASAVFSQPQVATCGLTEQEAADKYGTVDVYVSTFKPMVHTLSGRNERNMMKLVVDQRSEVVVGCHMVGDAAAEIMQGLAIALRCGATKRQFDATVGIHPSSAEEFVTMRTKTRTTKGANL